MQRLSLVIAAFSLVAVGIVLANRLPGATAQDDQTTPHAIVGAWHVTTYVEGQPPSPNMTTFYADGNALTSNRPVYPTASDAAAEARSAGHGAWVALDDRTVDLTFQVLTADVTGTYLGTRTLNAHLTYDEVADTWSGPFSATVTDPSGAVVSASFGLAEATRIVVVPMDEPGTPVAA